MIWLLRHWRLIAFAAALAGAAYGGYAICLSQWRAADLRASVAQKTAELEAERFARAKERNMQDAANAVNQKYQDKIAVLAANNNRLASATRGLRTVIASRIGEISSTTSGGDGARVYDALGQCIERYSGLAGISDGYASQINALRAWALIVAPQE